MVYFFKAILLSALIAVNGFFVAAEYSLLSVRRTRLEQLAREGDARALAAQLLLSDVGVLFSATQVGVTVASLLEGWLGAGFLAGLLDELLAGLSYRWAGVMAHIVSTAIAFLLVTVGMTVLGELAPKAFAYDRAERMSLLVSRPILLFVELARYPVKMLNAMARVVLRSGGSERNASPSVQHTTEEAKLIVSAIRKRGLLAEDQEEMIRSVFDLHQVLVRQVMVPRPKLLCIPLTQDLDTLMQQVIHTQHSRLPVFEQNPDHIIGILYTKDLLAVLFDRLRSRIPPHSPLDLRTLLHEPMIVPETMPLNRMLEEARRKHSQMALVVDEFGTFQGLVTIEDVLAQIVGEVAGETTVENAPGHVGGVRSFVVDGATTLRELADRHQLDLPRGPGYETLGGFMLARLGKIPVVGESVAYNQNRLTVVDMEGRRIARVKVEFMGSQWPGAPAVVDAGPTPGRRAD